MDEERPDLDSTEPNNEPVATPGGDESLSPALYFANLEEFVNRFVRFVWARKLSPSSTVWCDQWWKHDEAQYRLEALWRSFEVMRVESPQSGPASWLINVADPIMSALMDPTGTFRSCSGGHAAQAPLPVSPCPPELWQERG